MTDMDSIDILELPSDPFECRQSILSKTATPTLSNTARYITKQYERYELLETARLFSDYDLLDAAPSAGDTLMKLSLFPWIESSNELDKSLSLIMLSFYKNSYDSMRRALELIVVGSFFILDDIEMDKSRAWLKSNNNTPNFRRMLEKLVKYDPYCQCEESCKFSNYLLNLYYRLSDYIHVKGIEKSQRKIKSAMGRFNGVELLGFDEKPCKESLDLYIETVQAIGLLCALSTPWLLVGFDLDSKFGFNSPLSGFFEYDQAERIRLLIPEKFYPFINWLKETDERIRSIVEWFEDLPDLTQEEYTRQAEEFRKEHDFTKK
jgi:hypothetical protein